MGRRRPEGADPAVVPAAILFDPSGGSAVSATVTTTVDARGQSCPGPLVSLARALKDAASGDVFELLATDPGSRSDVPSWASISGNELIEAAEAGDGSFRYLIRKA
jgi:tRNA 2-thiouridine synthesizing protein A